MSKRHILYEGMVNEESLHHIPAFVAKQMLSYRATERQQAVWTLITLEATLLDFEKGIIPTDDWYSFLPRGSYFWLEQNPSRIAPCPIDTSVRVPDGWNHIDMWLIHWDTSNNDTVDVLDVTAITFIQEQE